jgi:glycosyltransferase involved in cell wall biosynthesis
MARVEAMQEEEREHWRALAAARVRERYSWEAVTDAYETLFKEMAG